MTYPPPINPALLPATFPAPPPAAIVGACPLSVRRCSITTLGLQGHPGGPADYTAEPAALAAGGAGRFVLAPGVDAFPVQWDLTGHAYVEILQLELYRRGNALPIWTKTLDYTAHAIGAHGSTPFDGDLSAGVHGASIPASAVNVAYLGGGNFPSQLLTVEHAPYKLVLRITQVAADTEVEVAARWIYLDVLVHDIRLSLGPAQWIPAVAPLGMGALALAQAQHYRDNRKRALTVATLATVAGQLAGGVDELSAGAAITARVTLTSNTFSKASKDFYCNTVFTSLLERWGDGPTLPIKATLRVRRADGTPAAEAAGAPALGNVALMWDWHSGVGPTVHGDAQAFVDAARDYRPRDWPHAVGNCHHHHGGKRAAPGNLHFEDLPANSIGGGAAAPAVVPGPPGNRPWCHYSGAIIDAANPDAGTSGVLFVPSRMAGDSYVLSVHLAYPTPATFNQLDLTQPMAGSIRVESPHTLQVWRRVEVATQLYKDPAGADAPNLAWGTVQNIFADACVEVRPPALPAAIPALQFRAACATVFPSLPPAPRLALSPAAGQDAGIYGLNFETYVNFRAAVALHMQGMQLAVAPVQPNDNAYLVAQLNHLYGVMPATYALEDLLIMRRADHALTHNQLRDRVLTTLGITNEDTYWAKVKDWADDVLPLVCAEHARVNNPGVFGIHLYHVEFLDDHHQQNSVAEASTTVSNFVNCPACNAATVALRPPRGFADPHKICACGLRLDESAHVTSVAPFRYMNGATDAWARQNLSRGQLLKIAVGGGFGTSAAISITHEIGHQLGMPHAGPEPVPITSITGGKFPPYHDHDDPACIMSYNFRRAPQLHFCGVCCLRIAGWSVGPSAPPDAANDQQTVLLSNHANLNPAQSPAPMAVYQAHPVNCAAGGCGRAFGLLVPSRHCGLCGQAFCHDHSQHRRPVRDPVVANPVENVRVCDTCDAIPVAAPLPGAIWQPDENASYCHLPACHTRFGALERKHHCRACGHVFCNAHTGHTRNVNRPLTEDGPIVVKHVCDACNARYV